MFRSLQPTVPAYTAISSMLGRLHRMSTITPEFSESRREEGTPLLPLVVVPPSRDQTRRQGPNFVSMDAGRG